MHLALLDDSGEVVGACFVLAEACDFRDGLPAWRLRGVAVDVSRQGTGLGRQLVVGATDHVRDRGAVLFWCHARIAVEPFYLGLGWNPDGGEYLEAGRPHRNMWLAL